MMATRSFYLIINLQLTVLAMFGGPLSCLNAQVSVWTGAVDNQFYSVPGNWTPFGIPNNSSDVRFTGAPTASSGLRIFDGLSTGGIRVLDGGVANLRPEGLFQAVFLEVGGSSNGGSGSFSTLNLLNFNNNTLLDVVGTTVGGFNSGLPGTGNLGNMQINSGTVLDTNVLIVGDSGNTGFMSAIGGGTINTLQLSVGRNVTLGSTSGSINVQGSGSSMSVTDSSSIGQTFPGAAAAAGALHALNGAAINLNTVEVGIGELASGAITASGAMVTGHTFNLGSVDGHGQGELISSNGGLIFADRIESFSDASSIHADAGGTISAGEIEMAAGTIFVDGGTLQTDTNLVLRSNSQLILSDGIIECFDIAAQDESSIDWSGGDIQIVDDFVVIDDGGLFNRQTVVPSSGSLLFSHRVDIQSELQVDGTLAAVNRISCSGNLILNDATIDGRAVLSDSCTSTVDGMVEFNGFVSGGGQFCGANSTIHFYDLYSPEGDDEGPVSIGFEGNVTFGNESILALGIFGSDSNQFDRLLIDGNLQISGHLAVGSADGFIPKVGDEFVIIETDGELTGEFEALGEGSIIKLEEGIDLVISYVGGDGNDVVLYSKGEILLGDVNLDSTVDLLDVQPFVDLISSGMYQVEADINQDGQVNLLDVDPFISLLAG